MAMKYNMKRLYYGRGGLGCQGVLATPPVRAHIPEISLTITRSELLILKQMIDSMYERRAKFISGLSQRSAQDAQRLLEDTYPEICDLKRKLADAR